MENRTILILGGAGKTGARVQARLQQRGLATRLASRSTPVPFDWTQRTGWGAALEGVSSAYISYQPDLAAPDAADDIATLADLARDAGLRHVVLLSGRGEAGAQAAEAALQAAGVPWTIVRASWFDQNFSEGHFVDGIRSGELALPVGDVLEPFVDADDVADVVTAALTESRHIGRLYEVTGPRAISFSQAVAEISEAVGRPIRYTQISPTDFAEGTRGAGVPEDVIALLDELFTVVLDGRNSAVQTGVADALGRPARDFADFARDAAASRVWKVGPCVPCLRPVC